MRRETPHAVYTPRADGWLTGREKASIQDHTTAADCSAGAPAVRRVPFTGLIAYMRTVCGCAVSNVGMRDPGGRRGRGERVVLCACAVNGWCGLGLRGRSTRSL